MNDLLFSVNSQVVLVSGGSRGIGRAIAQGFAERGATVIITGREKPTLEQTAEQISTGDSKVVSLVCDVANGQAITDTVEQVIKRFDRIDTLVNVAGVNRRKPSLELTEDDYDFVVDINLKGAFLMSQAVGRQMIRQSSGSQINIASLNTIDR